VSHLRCSLLWDAKTGVCVRTFVGHTYMDVQVTFSPDGNRILTGNYDQTAKLWDTETGTCLRTFAGHSSFVFWVAYRERDARNKENPREYWIFPASTRAFFWYAW